MCTVQLPSYETELTHELCVETAKKSNGVCLLMLSGKDSIAAWLQAKRYFTRIIPFHCASYPRLRVETEYFDYLEDVMCDRERGERIIRLVGEELPMGLARGMYQTMDDLDSILELGDANDFNKIEVCEYLRKELNLPRAWCAVGLSVGDSIDRRIYIKKIGGRNPNNMTFYPLADWERSEILVAIRNSGVKLNSTYLWSNRSISGVPSYTWLKILREHYPEDYERVLAMFPLAEAKTYREKLLDAIRARRKEMGIVDDENVSSSVGDEEVGVNLMPELGMEEVIMAKNGDGGTE